MIRLKPLLEIQLIKEALPLDMARRYTSIERNPDMVARQDAILDFLKQQPGAKTSRRGDRVAIPFTSDVPVVLNNPSRELQYFYKNLDDLREKANYQIRIFYAKHQQSGDDGKYFHGYPSLFYLVNPTIKDPYGREVKMSKYITALYMESTKSNRDYIESMITKDPVTGKEVFDQKFGATISAEEVRQKLRNLAKQDIEKLIQQYNEIPEVQEYRNNKPKSYYIVFSKHAYDVAGQSTNRGWTSCMNLYTGSNKRYVQWDIKNGTMVAYLVREDDLNIKNPTARVSIKPFVNLENKSDVLYEPEQSIYGTAPADFKKQVNDLITQSQPGKIGTFELVDTLYCDSKAHVTKNNQELVDHCQDLISAGKQATTVDEAKYIIQNFCLPSVDNWNPSWVSFEDAKGLYASVRQHVRIDPRITYSPVQFKFAWSFDITGATPESLKTFPLETNRLYMRLPNIRNFEGMKTKVNDAMFLMGFRGDNFNGLEAGPKVIDLGMYDRTHESVIKSFAGIPATVNQIKLDQTTILDMSIEQLIEELKPIQPRMFQYRLTLNDIEAGNDKLTKSMKAWMDRIPPATGEYGEIPNSQWRRMLWQISQQLPTLDWMFMLSMDPIRNPDETSKWVQTLD